MSGSNIKDIASLFAVGKDKQMNRIFEFTKPDNMCILASIAHAIMNGEYSFLSSEQSWDGMNYSFQDMEGVRGTISFCNDILVCLIRNDDEYIMGEDKISDKFFHGADKEILELAKREAMQYLLLEERGTIMPAVSAAFWGDKFYFFQISPKKN